MIKSELEERSARISKALMESDDIAGLRFGEALNLLKLEEIITPNKQIQDSVVIGSFGGEEHLRLHKLYTMVVLLGNCMEQIQMENDGHQRIIRKRVGTNQSIESALQNCLTAGFVFWDVLGKKAENDWTIHQLALLSKTFFNMLSYELCNMFPIIAHTSWDIDKDWVITRVDRSAFASLGLVEGE